MLSNIIKSIQDIMRQDAGVDGDAQRISQLVWMIFLKVFDDKEKEWELEDEDYKSSIPEKYRWRNWAADKEGITGDELLDFIDKMFKTLKSLNASKEDDPKGFIIREVFEDAYNYMKSGTLIRQVINKLNEIDFNKSEDRHLFNDVYEKILSDLQSAGNAGEYYTPRAVTQFVIDTVNPKLGEKFLDPACGTGGFLVCALENMKKQVKKDADLDKLQKNINGVEKKPLPHLLCTTNMILHGIEVPNVRHDNSLTRPLVDYGPSDMVDCIATNPPFGGVEEPGVELNFPSAYRTRETADLFLVLIMKLLRDEGRCGIVLPDSFLSGEGVKTRIKEVLLSQCNLHTIIRLPSGVFSPYTDIETNLLFFEKRKSTKEIWFFEHPLPQGYKKYTKTKPINSSEFLLEKEWWNNRGDDKFSDYAWRVDIKEVIDKNYNLDFKNPIKEEFIEISREDAIKKLEKNLEDLTRLIQKFRNLKLAKERQNWEEHQISYFLKERKKRYTPEEANKLGLKRIDKIDFSGNIFLSDNRQTKTGMILVKKGDLIISGINIERGAVSVYIGNEDVLATIHYSSYEFDKNKIDIDFFKLFLRSKTFKEIVNSQVKGGIKTELKPKKFLPLIIKIPKIETQRLIRETVMNLIYELETKIKESQKNSELLMEAVLRETFEA